MEYNELVKALRCDGNNIGQDSDGCTNKKCRYRDLDSACNIVSICEDAAAAITDLLVENQSLRNAANGFKARVEAAEARCKTLEKMVREYQDEIVPGYRERAKKAGRERDEAISDLTWAVNEYRRLTTETDLCGLCKYDLPPAGENGQTYECPGFCKDDCFKWRGQKEE